MDTSQGIAKLETLLSEILSGRTVGRVDAAEFPAELRALAGAVSELDELLEEASLFALNLSKGDLDFSAVPKRGNALAGPLKQLHAHIQHLVWQARQIAKGDYEQQLDYFGELSDVFNEMRAQLKLREQKLLERQEQMQHIFDGIRSPLIVTGLAGERLFANNAAREYCRGAQPGEDPLIRCAMDSIGLCPGACDVLEPVRQTWFSLSITAIDWGENTPALLLSFSDITEMRRQADAMKLAAEHDTLTGLYNRRAAMELLAHVVSHASGQEPACVAMLDIDGLKEINDTLGHIAGDTAIRLFAQQLKRSTRGTDYACRIGGDEFLVLLPKCREKTADDIFARTQYALTRAARESGFAHSLLFSYGICEVHRRDMGPDEAYALADEKMYRNKQENKKAR